MSLSNYINYKIKKIYPCLIQSYNFKVIIKRVVISSFNKLTNQGVMTVVATGTNTNTNTNTKEDEVMDIIFHRNDFKNKFQLVKLLLILQIPFNVIIIQDDSKKSRMLCLDREFLNSLKMILESMKINKYDFTKVLI